MSEHEQRFIDFFVALWNNHPECFKINYDAWTEKIPDDEDWVFSVVLRTLIWNDKEAERLFHKIGGYAGVKNWLAKSKLELKSFLKEEADKINFGDGQEGAHRDNRHREPFPRTLIEYLEKMGRSQKKFINGKNFDTLYHGIMIYYSKDLTSWDILERLYWSKRAYHLEVHPEKFYLTGGGERDGLKKIYSLKNVNVGGEKLIKLGEELTGKIRKRIKISEDILRYKLEDILCIYQKDRNDVKSENLLENKISPESFADKYTEEYCKSKHIC